MKEVCDRRGILREAVRGVALRVLDETPAEVA